MTFYRLEWIEGTYVIDLELITDVLITDDDPTTIEISSSRNENYTLEFRDEKIAKYEFERLTAALMKLNKQERKKR